MRDREGKVQEWGPGDLWAAPQPAAPVQARKRPRRPERARAACPEPPPAPLASPARLSPAVGHLVSSHVRGAANTGWPGPCLPPAALADAPGRPWALCGPWAPDRC